MMVHGDSILTATCFIGLGALAVVMSLEQPQKKAKAALEWLIGIAIAIPLLGVDWKIPWTFLVEASIAMCLSLIVFSLFWYGRRQLEEGEYDQPVEDEI